MTFVKHQLIMCSGLVTFHNMWRMYVAKRRLSYTALTYFKEVTIPVPWGKIAGKWWGSTDHKPLLCIHGFRDNCGSFDKLIPFLIEDEKSSYLAIDLPGHGLSSPFPPGMTYNFIDYIFCVQQIYDYFNFSKLSFLGHSLGSMISFITTILYPEKVNFIICIDALSPLQSTVSKESVKNSVDTYMKCIRFNCEPPSYSWEEILQKMKTAHQSTLDIDSIKCLLRRNIAPSKKFPGKYYFTSDPMLKVRSFFNWTQDQMMKDAANICNPIFICEAKHMQSKKYRKSLYEITEVLRKNNQNCDFHTIDGIHHLHLNEPKKIGALIKNFLNKHHNVENCDLTDYSIFSQPVDCLELKGKL